MRDNLLKRRTVCKVGARKRALDSESQNDTQKSLPTDSADVSNFKVSSVGEVTVVVKKAKLEAKKLHSYSKISSKSRSTTNSILVKDVASSVSKYEKVSDNPHVTKVYKSLFTSSQKEPPALQSPWVTYNPYRL